MTRKHFIEIAKIIREHTDKTNKEGFEMFVDELCITFKQINPRFDSQRFKAACIL
jgi:hypothetical protein|tara:strand:+ start:779 stop:943 length:165 start_codon:yes stop_codon:yes gene_type:complete